MIGSADVPVPDRRELRAAALAGLAEAGVLFLPAHAVVSQAALIGISVAAAAPAFAAAFVAAVLLACRFAGSRNLWSVAGAGSVALGLLLGHGDPNAIAFSLAVAAIVALRAVTLGIRDWRSPIHAELGWGAAALGIETVLAAGGQADWRGPLLVIVPVFFAAGLASRATSVWAPRAADDLSEETRAGWLLRSVLWTGGLVVATASAVALGLLGGLFARIGSWLAPAGNAFVALFTWSLAQLARPVFWLVDRLHIDPAAARLYLERLRGHFARNARASLQDPTSSALQRVLGFLVFVGIAYALIRVLRRLRPEPRADAERVPDGTVAAVAPLPAVTRIAQRLRRDLPADAVRRWYAELLLELERHGRRPDPSLTPAELEPELARAWPEAAPAFQDLTRAYQDVRYGAVALGAAELRTLGAQRAIAMRAVRHGPPAEAPGDRSV